MAASLPVDTSPAGTLRDRIVEALYSSRRNGLGGMTEADAVAHMADAVLAALPAATNPTTEEARNA